MSKFKLVILVVLFCQSTLFSQVWLEVGAKAMYGLNGFYNKNLYDDSGNTFKLGSGLSYGAEININFADKHGINLEALFSNNVQDFSFTDELDINYKHEINWKNLDLYVLYRSYSSGGVYFELGPKISIVNSITHDLNGIDISGENYNKTYYSGALGFGGFIAGNEFFSLKMGIRVDYAFGDLVSQTGQDNDYPFITKQYETYKSSNPWSANISLGVNFAIGGVAKAQCGERVFMIGNGYR